MKILLYIVNSVLLSGDVSLNPGPPRASYSSKPICDSDIFKIYSQNVQSLCNKLLILNYQLTMRWDFLRCGLLTVFPSARICLKTTRFTEVTVALGEGVSCC